MLNPDSWGNNLDSLSPKARHTVECILSKYPLEGLINLKELYLTSNQIEDITPLLAKLTNLHLLGFIGEQLPDLSPPLKI
jgi:Leucine-rich repeat (LRR) protein